ncbi:multidrug effflux MFS transporter [Szabonella alba]|uniref:Multidrug effflux MFS transporter n=1 Tax=Szabonella alba TaxID=2804194 RepID=A0A8K0VBK5_9RHOB|nr:multidrug effflux MFS transporter [Szabonella alba]MBL4917233.1 multidrug effflux MFS transporter [Szabonella alba]
MNAPTQRLSQVEFIALIAMLFATIAFSIDAMLPAMPEIGATLSPENPNRAQLVVGLFFLGMGIGTLFAGPLSDRFGRKRVILASGAIYCIAALVCWLAQSLEVLLAARLVQGLGAAGPRTVSLAIVRDLFKGRDMARIMSFAMMVFMIVPALAPLAGQGIIRLAGWHAIFLAFILFSGLSMLWLALRQPETLPPEARKPIDLGSLATAARELFSYRVVNVSILIQALTTGVLMATISSIQGIYEQRFGMGESFPLWFALGALIAAGASFLNSRIVMVLGMRKVAANAYAGALAATLIYLLVILAGPQNNSVQFAGFFLWTVLMFGMMGLTMGNLNALAMEPVGHIAGLAASLIASVSTVLGVMLAVPIGLAFDGTSLPLVLGAAVLLSLALGAMQLIRRQ